MKYNSMKYNHGHSQTSRNLNKTYQFCFFPDAREIPPVICQISYGHINLRTKFFKATCHMLETFCGDMV